MKKILILAILAISTISCMSTPSRDKMQADIKNYSLPATPDKNSAMVYVVRPERLTVGITYGVFLDGQDNKSQIGYNRASNYIYFKVTPGNHMVYSKLIESASVMINAKAGEIIFLKHEGKTGVMIPQNKISLIDEVEGKYWIKKTTLGTLLKKN